MARHDDLSLMQYLDGELTGDEAREIETQVEASEDDALKLAALRQIGESVRTHLELSADAAEPRLDALWSNIERRIEANGVTRHAAVRAADPVVTRRATSPRATSPDDGLIASLRRWWSEYRGHLFTSALTAGAVAALILVLRPPSQHTIIRTVEVPAAAPPTMVPASVTSTPPSVDYLDVTDGSGTVMTLERDKDDDTAATVIWVTRDKLEDPI